MKLDVNLSINKEMLDNPMGFSSTHVASGWVEVEGMFKFPVQVLKNKEDKMFVRFPSKRNQDDTYSNVVFPVDKKVREEIEKKVIDQVHKEISDSLNRPEITDIRLTILPDKEVSGNVKTRAIGSLKMCGFTINGFMIKESETGFFVQNPQYRDEHGQYHDTFYATNKVAKIEISNSILEAYENKLKEIEAHKMVSEKHMELENTAPKV